MISHKERKEKKNSRRLKLFVGYFPAITLNVSRKVRSVEMLPLKGNIKS